MGARWSQDCSWISAAMLLNIPIALLSPCQEELPGGRAGKGPIIQLTGAQLEHNGANFRKDTRF